MSSVLAAVFACNIAVVKGGTPFAGRLGRGEVADCAIVLGARVYEGGNPSPVLEDRLATALALYREGKVRRLLVSGDHGKPTYDEVTAMAQWLEARGVRPEDVFLDHAGFDTYSSIVRARDVFAARRVVVVTQRFHMPRALYIARSLGLAADGTVADRRLYRGAIYCEAREVASRIRAWVDVLSKRTPRHLGAPMPITGDGRVTRG